MAFTMDAAVARSYEDAAIMLVQQTIARMKSRVRLVNGVRATTHSFDRIGQQSLVENQTRNQETQYSDSPWSRRVVGPRRWNGAELIDTLDKLQMSYDPEGDVMRAFQAAAQRTCDDIIIEAALGTARTGVDGAGSETFPAGQVIAVDEHDLDHESAAIYTSGNVPLTIGKFSAALMLLGANEADSYDEGSVPPIFCSVSSAQMGALRRQIPYTNEDYTRKELEGVVAGTSRTLMGVQLVRTQRNLVDGNSYERVIMWHRDGIGMAVWEEISAKMEQIATKNYNVQCWIEMIANAVRIESERVVEIKCTVPSIT